MGDVVTSDFIEEEHEGERVGGREETIILKAFSFKLFDGRELKREWSKSEEGNDGGKLEEREETEEKGGET